MWPFRKRLLTMEMVKYDHAGWEIYDESSTHRRWYTQERDAVLLSFSIGDPTINHPYDFTNQTQMAAFYEQQAQQNQGVMLEVAPTTIAGIPGMRGVFKYRLPNTLALYFVGIVVVAFRDVSFQFNTEAMERGTTGMREALVGVINPQPMPETEPITLSSTEEFFTMLHNAPLQRILPDNPEYDDVIPDHPLSKVRRLQRHLIATTQLDERLRTSPAYRYRPYR